MKSEGVRANDNSEQDIIFSRSSYFREFKYCCFSNHPIIRKLGTFDLGSPACKPFCHRNLLFITCPNISYLRFNWLKVKFWNIVLKNNIFEMISFFSQKWNNLLSWFPNQRKTRFFIFISVANRAKVKWNVLPKNVNPWYAYLGRTGMKENVN